MSKKLIAVASAAALALAGLVGIAPANSAVGAFGVVMNGAITETTSRDGTTATKAWQVNVPSADVIRYRATIKTGLDEVQAASWNSVEASAVKYTVETPAANDIVTVTSTGGVKLLTAAQYADAATTSATGTQSLSLTNTAAALEFYAYTTSTTAGTVVVSSGGSASTTHLVGVSTAAYKLNLTAPANAGLSGKITMTGTIVDAFGNNLTTALTHGSFDFTQVGATAPADSTTGFSYNTVTKVYSITWTAPATAQGVAVQATLRPAVAAPTAVTAFGTPVSTVFAAVNVVDSAAQVTALTAQVAALQAQMADMRTKARSVTKKKYNTLARKWNAANPGARVALKK